jgi:hypothetical protein
MTIDPAMIVIGGGLSAAHAQLLDPLRAALPAHLGLPFAVPIVGARLGAEAAAHGALVRAFQQHADGIYRVEGMSVPPITPLGSSQIPAPSLPSGPVPVPASNSLS